MKVIILAAGQGIRLKPLTDSKPKCMVEYKNKMIIDYILDTVNSCNINDIAIVDGYKKEVLENAVTAKNIKFYTNEDFDKTNMVSTLFSATDFMDDDIIISYADIIYQEKVLQKLIDSKGDFNVVVDKKWRELWEQRMENPLEDAETLKIKDGNIIELGKKPSSYDDIEGQYIGLIKISKKVLHKVIEYYNNLDRKQIYDGKDYDNMYMTSFIQMIIDNLMPVQPVFIEGGWLEIDCFEDMKSSMIL